MRHGLRAAMGAAALLLTVSTGCSGGEASPEVPTASGASASNVAPSPSPPDLTEVIDRTRTELIAAVGTGADAPGRQGLMLVEAWPDGAAYAWETRDQRLCSATVAATTVRERGCAHNPLDPPVRSPRGVQAVYTLFTDGWVRLFAADHQEVTSATCGDTPVEVRRVGTVASGARTLYAVWFPDYTKGSLALSLSHDGATSGTLFDLGEAGDHACVPTGPEYATADAVMKAMGAGGVECRLLRRAQANFGSGLDCLAEVDGAEVENEIHVLDPARFTHDDIGDSIAGRRQPPYSHTIVAAGNWYVWVRNPDYAPQVAKALQGVLLKPLEEGKG
ncbi:hypothetical protein ACFVZW_07440 [Streptomyces sp. NPDC059567]|uniref:hypothetical protein n=1 Tax=Streptomyces sp. NPDC059567 TaxID=3346867 RepID=UPI003698D8E7